MQISDSGDLVTVQSQQINSFLYIPVQISQLGLKVYFLKKIHCPANNTTQKSKHQVLLVLLMYTIQCLIL